MDKMKQTLIQGLPELGLDLPEEILDTLCGFGHAMVKQNEVMNLTGITEDSAVAKLHLLDSLTVLSTADLRGKTLIDVGCGAGFPGVPLAIACPDATVTLLDSPAEYPAGADGTLCEGRWCRAGHEGRFGPGRTGRVQKCHCEVGPEAGGSPGISH